MRNSGKNPRARKKKSRHRLVADHGAQEETTTDE
jgi:hypothetical protein